jgi:ribosomal protein L33
LSNPKQKQKAPKVVLTPEQIAARELAQKEERIRLEKYDYSLTKMSHRQLTSEIKRTIRGEHVKEGNKRVPVPGLTIAFATILGTVLANSKTMEPRLRKDQFNPNSNKRMLPF